MPELAPILRELGRFEVSAIATLVYRCAADSVTGCGSIAMSIQISPPSVDAAPVCRDNAGRPAPRQMGLAAAIDCAGELPAMVGTIWSGTSALAVRGPSLAWIEDGNR